MEIIFILYILYFWTQKTKKHDNVIENHMF